MSLTLAEARERARLITNVSYDLEIDLTDTESARCRNAIRFGCTRPGATTFLELARASSVSVDGRPDASYDGDRILLTDLAERNEVVVEARLPYVTDGEGLHTFTDPADGETYVSAYAGVDVAQKVYPCFDQNDLKATISLTVVVPESWSVLANGGRAARHEGRWRFEPTPPIPPALFVLCAGPWHSVTWEHDGRTFGWHARRSLAAALDRDAEELIRTTDRCFDHYGSLFDEPYAFGSYHQVFVPGLNWEAMENPGCVTYNDELLPAGLMPESRRRHRAIVVAHEMAHMWFGNLVTMHWWEDTWLQESFADYMGFRVAQEAAGVAGTFVDFVVGRQPAAYVADEYRSTHPVAARAEDVPDAGQALGIFDAISYAKGNSVLRQLVTWLGDEPFLAGVNAYFRRNRFGNATLADFVDALDGVTDRDVRGWVAAWLQTSGFDTLEVSRDAHGPVVVRKGRRPHRVRITGYDAALGITGSRLVDLADEPVRVDDAAVIVPNSGGETYARIRLDEQSWRAVVSGLSSITDDEARAVLWSAVFDLVRSGDLAADDFLALVARHVPREPRVTIVEPVLRWTRERLVPRYLAPGAVGDTMGVLVETCEAGLASQPAAEIATALTEVLAATTPDAALLSRWLDEGRTDNGVEVDPRLRWAAVGRLAALDAIDTTGIDAERRRDGTVLGELGAATALAALPSPERKASAWAAMFQDPDVSNRRFASLAGGFWNPEQLPLVRPYIGAYLTEAPVVARARGQAFAQLVGRTLPKVPLTDAEVAALEAALAGDLPTALRRVWNDHLDELRTAQRALSRDRRR